MLTVRVGLGHPTAGRHSATSMAVGIPQPRQQQIFGPIRLERAGGAHAGALPGAGGRGPLMAGVVGALVVVPYYTRPSEAGIVAHYRMVVGNEDAQHHGT